MSYIQDNLMPNEKIILSARVHPAVFLPGIIALLGTIISVFFAAVTPTYKIFMYFMSAIFLIFTVRVGFEALIMMLTTEFAVTNRRIIAKTGFIHRRTLEMLLPKVESVLVYQNILGRAMNFGNVTITGTGGTKEKFSIIANPIAVRKKINQIIEYYAQSNISQTPQHIM
ncbi:MAG: PH domain-containing protein [Anaerolineales bacterium]